MIGGRELFEFGSFVLDASERQLRRGEEDIQLTPKAFDVLLLLLRNSGRTVAKEDFMREVWPDTAVEEGNLTDNIFTLRQILGDDPRNPTFIKTVPRHGYRFVAPVRQVHPADQELFSERTRQRLVIEENDDDAGAQETVALQPYSRPRPARALALVALMLSVAVAAFVLLRQRSAPAAGPPPAGAPLARSIAVLPFKPLLSSARDPALELGMTDALISRLSSIRDVTVRPTSAVMKYAAGVTDFAAAGEELKVDALLDGKVQRSGDRVRLSVQLVRARDGATVWAGTFDEKFTDIFALQDAISQRVTEALAVRLTHQQRQELSKRYTDNVAAYQLYLNGRYHWSSFAGERLLLSINYFEEALKLDPKYALAYSGMADAYAVIAIYGPLTAAEAMPKAREAALQALQLDPDLAPARASLGAVKMFYERDWEGARRELTRAMELEPNNVDAPELYAYYLQAQGRVEEALPYLERARALAPTWSVAKNDYLLGLLLARRYDAAIEACRRDIALEPRRSTPYYILGEAYLETGRVDEALRTFEQGMAVDPQDRLKSDIGYLHARRGDRAKALSVIAELENKPDRRRLSWLPIHIARVYAGLGDHDQVFAWLRKAHEQKMPFLYRVRIEPHFDSIRSDPRYAELLRSINLAP